MNGLEHLLENNRAWAAGIEQQRPGFFRRLEKQQTPEYMWIGCADSRVPANEIIGLLPGDVFVHRNVANLVIHSDMNCLSVLQYAVDVLRVRHIIVCGHYGCGGVRASIEDEPHGLIDNWLRPVRDVARQRRGDLQGISGEQAMLDRLCELNVIAQVVNVGHTTIVQEAWRRGQELRVHGWIYGIGNGLLKDLGAGISSDRDLRALEERGERS